MRFLQFLLLVFSPILIAQTLQLPKIYKGDENITNWMMSEKLDGIRGYWNGKKLFTKRGKILYPPDWFIKNFPPFELDGELWTTQNDFENIQSIVMTKNPSPRWKQISYNIFEVPNAKGDFPTRLLKIRNWLKKNPTKFIKIIPQTICKGQKELNIFLNQVIKNSGEGIIAKNPNKLYFTGRDKNSLKVKKFYDTEGKVIAHNYRKSGKLKSLVIEMKNGVIFNLGGGFSEKQRENPPAIGKIVTFKYYSFTKNKKPKFASFLRVREELQNDNF